MFETTGKLDEALLKETWWQMFGDGNKIVAVFVLLLAAVVVVLGYLWQEPTYYVLAGAVVVVNVLQNAANVYRQRKTSLARMRESNGVPETETTTAFLENGIKIHNHHSGGTAMIPYESIKRFFETEHYLLLGSQSHQVAVVFKNAELDQEGLIAYLKNQAHPDSLERLTR